MEKLKFKMTSNEEKVFDDVVNYKIINNNLVFSVKDGLFKYDLTNNILIKKDKESLITIDVNNNIILIKYDSMLDDVELPIFETSLNIDKKIITMSYTLDIDNTKNIIIIEY